MRVGRIATVLWPLALLLAAFAATAQQRQLKPGFNLFSRDQDIQLGKEAATEIQKQVDLVGNRELNDYISDIGRKLASQPQADKYPYSFRVVNDKSINAFALPGGPTFVNTGLIAAVDNEAQLAGVIAHEISHVALRHGTNQATRANLIQLPALLASKALGSGSLLGQLGQLGIGLGANSVFLKFSRGAETEADLLGSRIMAGAGYNPVEMARFFQKLEKEGGQRMPAFFSSHPDPRVRMQAIQGEVRYMPRRTYVTEQGQLPRMKSMVAKLPPPRKLQGGAIEAAALSIPDSRPSNRMLDYQGREFRLSYPDNWKTSPGQASAGLTIAPPSGVHETQAGANVAYGTLVNTFSSQSGGADLRKATDELIGKLRSSDSNMRIVANPREIQAAGQPALVTLLAAPSAFPGQTESIRLVTLARPGGLFYLVFVAPQSEAQHVDRTFDRMLESLNFVR